MSSDRVKRGTDFKVIIMDNCRRGPFPEPSSGIGASGERDALTWGVSVRIEHWRCDEELECWRATRCQGLACEKHAAAASTPAHSTRHCGHVSWAVGAAISVTRGSFGAGRRVGGSSRSVKGLQTAGRAGLGSARPTGPRRRADPVHHVADTAHAPACGALAVRCRRQAFWSSSTTIGIAPRSSSTTPSIRGR